MKPLFSRSLLSGCGADLPLIFEYPMKASAELNKKEKERGYRKKNIDF